MRASELHTIVREAPGLSSATRSKYLRDLNAWVGFAGPEPKDWTAERVRAFRKHLGKIMQPQSADRLMRSVQFASRWWARINHADDFAATRERAALTSADATRLLATCDDSPLGLRDFAIIVVGLETGMSRSALSEFNLTDLHTRPYPHVRVALNDHWHTSATVPLSDTALAAIEPWRKFLDTRRGPLFRPLVRRMGATSPTWLVMRNRNDGISASAIYKMIANRAELIGLAINPQTIRQAFITWRMHEGCSASDVATMLSPTPSDAFAAQMRATTPPWLAEVVNTKLKGKP